MNSVAVVDIPANLVPFFFSVGEKRPPQLTTRDEMSKRMSSERDELDDSLTFHVVRFDLMDAVSRLGSLEVEIMTCSSDPVALKTIVGMPAMFARACGTESERSFQYYQGVVASFAATRWEAKASFYRAVIMPRLWTLTLTRNCRIFQDKTAPDIIKEVLQDHNINAGDDVKFDDLTSDYEQRNYCVQYRETDYDFVARLMEEEGISYFIEHVEERDVIRLIDTAAAYRPCAPFSSVIVGPTSAVDVEKLHEETVESFFITQSLKPSRVLLRDYNFEKSEKFPGAQADATATGAGDVYDYPGRFLDDSRAKKLAKVRIEEFDTRAVVAQGQSDYRCLCAGRKFELVGHPRVPYNRHYWCTSVNHFGTQGSILDEDAAPLGTGGSTYGNVLECIPDDVLFRPGRVTSKPVIPGVQTAKVVGPSGEEIYTDEYLRVKVQFHWDREGSNDENSSCWLRVAQTWADSGFGAVVIPRIGTEVLVEFLEGDPDRPLVNGVIYNDQHMPPFVLPGKKMQTGIKSNTTPGGGGSNEIRLDDTSGKEEVYIHAQYDQNNVVEHNETTKVGVDRTENVGANETITIGANRTESVGVNETISIGSNRDETVGANESITIALNRIRNVGIANVINVGAAQNINVGAVQSTNVGASQSNNIGASQSNDIGANRDSNIGSSDSTSVGKDQSTSVGKNKSTTVGENYTIAVKKDLSEQADKNVLIDGGDQVTIQSGKAVIQLKKNGDILIDGKDISIKASGNIVMKAQKILETDASEREREDRS